MALILTQWLNLTKMDQIGLILSIAFLAGCIGISLGMAFRYDAWFIRILYRLTAWWNTIAERSEATRHPAYKNARLPVEDDRVDAPGLHYAPWLTKVEVARLEFQRLQFKGLPPFLLDRANADLYNLYDTRRLDASRPVAKLYVHDLTDSQRLAVSRLGFLLDQFPKIKLPWDWQVTTPVTDPNYLKFGKGQLYE
jgi:hypothetical protein